MQVALGFSPASGQDWGEAASFYQEAEALGVHAAWTAERWGYDAATPCAFLAAHTRTMAIGTGIMQLGSRTPAMLAMTALTLDAMSGGRFRLGLGASGPQVMEGWHGVPFARTLPRLRDAINICRTVFRGERLEYAGEYYQLPLPGGEGKALRPLSAPADIPIYLATLSPKSLELTGELADGWVGTSFMPEHSEVFFQHIRRGAERAGRTLADLDLQVNAGVVAFGDDPEQLVAPRKAGLAFTLGAMGSRRHNFYNDAFKRAGYADEASEVQRLWLAGRRDEATARVPDELVMQTNLLGTPPMVRDRVRAYRDAGVTTVSVSPAGQTPAARLETLARFLAIAAEVSAEPV